jgi:hypothetical protein
MVDVISYTQCSNCKVRIQAECIQFHNCEDEKKIKEVELQLQAALDENSKLKIQNTELKKSVESIKKEVNNSFEQMREIVKGYQKKYDDAKNKSTTVEEVK